MQYTCLVYCWLWCAVGYYETTLHALTNFKELDMKIQTGSSRYYNIQGWLVLATLPAIPVLSQCLAVYGPDFIQKSWSNGVNAIMMTSGIVAAGVAVIRWIFCMCMAEDLEKKGR